MSDCEPGIDVIFTITYGAQQALEASGQEPTYFLDRFCVGDFGFVNEETVQNNQESAHEMFAEYKTLRGQPIFVTVNKRVPRKLIATITTI